MLAPDIRLIASVLLKGSTATTSPEVMLPCAVEPKVRTGWVVVAVRVVKPGEERTATTWPEVMLSYNQRTGCTTKGRGPHLQCIHTGIHTDWTSTHLVGNVVQHRIAHKVPHCALPLAGIGIVQHGGGVACIVFGQMWGGKVG